RHRAHAPAAGRTGRPASPPARGARPWLTCTARRGPGRQITGYHLWTDGWATRGVRGHTIGARRGREDRMAIPKYMGTETEYGITVVGRPDFNPVLASSLVVNSYSSDGRPRAKWDYEEENPLRDARGFTQAPSGEAPPEDDIGLANSILTNGARFYVDHAHPEIGRAHV